MTFRLTDLLSSKAKGEVLRALSFQRGPTSLRAVAAITELHVRAVEQALVALIGAGIVQKRRQGRNVLLCLDESNPATAFLREVFQKETLFRISEDAKRNVGCARDVLRFISSSNSILNRARLNKVTHGF